MRGMSGGVAVQANLLCVTWSAAVGHVFLFDVEARQRVSAWTLPVCERGFSDAAGIAMDPNFHLFVADPQGTLSTLWDGPAQGGAPMPAELLALDGISRDDNINGTWTLTVENVSSPVGTLDGWNLYLSSRFD